MPKIVLCLLGLNNLSVSDFHQLDISKSNRVSLPSVASKVHEALCVL